MMKIGTAVLILSLISAACAPPVSQTAAPDRGIGNPASVFCEVNAGRLELRTAADGSVSGTCILPDGTQCDEWAFFRGECMPAATPAQAALGAASALPDVQPVMLQVLLPQDGSLVDLQECQVTGTSTPSAIVSVNDQILIAGADGTFHTTVMLEPGVNLIEVVASNAAGSEAYVDLTVTYEP
jgi:putative hemolysin